MAPPTLILRWPVTDGSGSVLAETKNSRPMYFKTVGSYPSWTTGPTGAPNTAITASGSTNSGAYAATDTPIFCDYLWSPDHINYRGITIIAKFRRTGNGGGGILSGFYLPSSLYPAPGNPASVFAASGSITSLYITSTGYLRFGWRSARALSARWPSVSGPFIPIGEWKTVTAKVIAPNVGSIFMDGTWYRSVLDATCLPSNASLSLDGTFYNDFWTIGTGYNSYDTGNYQNFCGGLNRSFYGDVGTCEVYCGQIPDEDIENPPVVPTISSIMFSCNT